MVAIGISSITDSTFPPVTFARTRNFIILRDRIIYVLILTIAIKLEASPSNAIELLFLHSKIYGIPRFTSTRRITLPRIVIIGNNYAHLCRWRLSRYSFNLQHHLPSPISHLPIRLSEAPSLLISSFGLLPLFEAAVNSALIKPELRAWF